VSFLNNLPIAIVGVGALGSEVCRQLAQNKFTDVLIIDPDRLEEHNVRCSTIFQGIAERNGTKVFREFKVNLALNEIHRCFALSWNGFTTEIADVDLSLLASTRLILSCTDSTLARVETTRVARILGIPMIDVGVMGHEIAVGRVAWFAANSGAACYLCGISEKRRSEILSYAASSSLGCRTHEEFPSMTGVLNTVRETAATMLSFIQRWQMFISLDHSFAVRLQLDQAEEWSQLHLNLPRSATCPWHEKETGIWLSIPEDRPICESFPDEKLCLQLLWPQCLTARCSRCGARSEPQRRVPWVRRKAVCTSCGARGTCEPIEVIDALASNDVRAELTPRQLGLPKQELYFFRRCFVPTKKDFDEPVS
jgi:molybdopterin/thiamine biosynthesis adenylyltransferase